MCVCVCVVTVNGSSCRGKGGLGPTFTRHLLTVSYRARGPFLSTVVSYRGNGVSAVYGQLPG